MRGNLYELNTDDLGTGLMELTLTDTSDLTGPELLALEAEYALEAERIEQTRQRRHHRATRRMMR